MTNKTSKQVLVFAAAMVTGLAGCGGGGNEGPTESYGSMSLGISDGPIHHAQKVCITFTEIEVKPVNGPPVLITLDVIEKINLLEFQGTSSVQVLTDERLLAGRYDWMRLGVDALQGSNGGAGDTGNDFCDGEASYIVMDDGGTYNIYVPSGDDNGLKLFGGYTVPANDQVSLTAEFDLGKSLTVPPGQSPDVLIRPTIKLVDNNEVGTLIGQVDNGLAEAPGCEPSVYVFNNGATPDAIENSVATGIVESMDMPDGSVEWHYEIGFLLARNYEAAFTCNGTDFVPVNGKPAAISAGGTSTVVFLESDAPAP